MTRTIEDAQAFALYHGLPIPDGLLRSGEGGIDLTHPERYRVVVVAPTDRCPGCGVPVDHVTGACVACASTGKHKS